MPLEIRSQPGERRSPPSELTREAGARRLLALLTPRWAMSIPIVAQTAILTRCLLVIALFLEGASAAAAATITVGPGCSLVEAVLSANLDLAHGGCVDGDGADILELTADVTLSVSDNDLDGANGLPSVTSPITIRGNGHHIARDTSSGAPEFRIFHVSEEGELILEDVDITGGSARESRNDVARGGAIFNLGILRLDRATLADNNAVVVLSGGGPGAQAAGGAIYNQGEIDIRESHLVSNKASAENSTAVEFEVAFAEGGAIYSGSSALTRIELSSFEGNLATALGAIAHARGGAVYSESGVRLLVSSLSVNFARAEGSLGAFAFGGALWLGHDEFGEEEAGSVLAFSFLEGNGALAPSVEGEAAGGAIFTTGEEHLEAVSTTFASNSVAPPTNATLPSGGAIEARSASQLALVRLTFVGNGVLGHGGPVEGTTLSGESIHPVLLWGSIVSGSVPGPPACSGDIDAFFGGNNFGCLPGDPAVTGLSSLADSNGGPTPTFALDPTSNAINAVTAVCDFSDQRGVSPLGDCDSGAYEHNPCTEDDALEVLADDSSDDLCPGNRLYLSEPQTHRHCDADWVWFNALAGKTYELRTSNLQNGANTLLRIHEPGCGELLATDDNSGGGLASRLLVTTAVPQSLDVEITQALDSYNPGWNPPETIEGYDVQVLCIENCACTPPEGPNLELESDTLEDITVTYEACSTLTASDNWNVAGDANVTLRAGETVVLGPGASVLRGGTLRVMTDPTLLPP